MNFRLVDVGWDTELEGAVAAEHSGIRVISPFIKKKAAERLLRRDRTPVLQVITRFNLDDFADGVSDMAALRLLLESGARIRGIRNLHSKLYLFGDTRAIATSANLTESALTKNHEFGFVAEDANIVAQCRQYFDDLWERGQADLTPDRLAAWHVKVTAHQARGAPPFAPNSLGDEGVDAGLPSQPENVELRIMEASQAFVKFFGRSGDRAERSMPVLDAVTTSGCHWACTYPSTQRPRQVQDGDLIFMSRLVENPQDILVYGWGIGMRHVPGRDDATEAEKKRRPQKEHWSSYIRVHHTEFLAGTLSNGVSLYEMMGELGPASFSTSLRRTEAGEENVDPRKSYQRKPGIKLTHEGRAWLHEQLLRAFAEHGKLPADELAKLDWPDIVVDPDA